MTSVSIGASLTTWLAVPVLANSSLHVQQCQINVWQEDSFFNLFLSSWRNLHHTTGDLRPVLYQNNSLSVAATQSYKLLSGCLAKALAAPGCRIYSMLLKSIAGEEDFIGSELFPIIPRSVCPIPNAVRLEFKGAQINKS